MIRTVKAVRYVTPLRQGSSLPAVVLADDGEQYVMKFSGSGHGAKALVAELVAGSIALALGLPVPELVYIELEPSLGSSEPNAEIYDLLAASVGLNMGMRFLPNAFGYDMLLIPPPDQELASSIVWFDALVTNIDRTPRNVNLLIWQGDLWLIDHGSCLYFHHRWDGYKTRARTPFPQIKDHTLLPFARALAEVDPILRERLPEDLIWGMVNAIPDVWLQGEPSFASLVAHREAYATYLLTRLESADAFVEEAKSAHAQLL